MKNPKRPITLSISNGHLSFVYSDNLIPLTHLGACEITRASHVEPAENGGWEATIIKDNVVLGPFPTRQEALDAEVDYIEENIL